MVDFLKDLYPQKGHPTGMLSFDQKLEDRLWKWEQV